MPDEVEDALEVYKAARREAGMCMQSLTCPRRAATGKSRCERHGADRRRYDSYATRHA